MYEYEEDRVWNASRMHVDPLQGGVMRTGWGVANVWWWQAVRLKWSSRIYTLPHSNWLIGLWWEFYMKHPLGSIRTILKRLSITREMRTLLGRICKHAHTHMSPDTRAHRWDGNRWSNGRENVIKFVIIKKNRASEPSEKSRCTRERARQQIFFNEISALKLPHRIGHPAAMRQ